MVVPSGARMGTLPGAHTKRVCGDPTPGPP